jgi:protein SCO1/2
MEAKVKSQKRIDNPNERTIRRFLWGALIVVIVGILGANIWSSVHQRLGAPTKTENPLSDLSVHNRVSDFSLTDQNGAPLALSDLQGKIWVADFIFTNCVTICPLMTEEMAKLQKQFASEDVTFVSFSVDPERDTPEVLSHYAARYGVVHDRWVFLTGEKTTIYQLARESFNLAAGHQGSEILHSTRFVLVDRQGQVRGYYDSRNRAHLQQLRQDTKALLREKSL